MPTTSTTTDVIDAHGAIKNLNDRTAPGRAAAANSPPVALSNEDLAAINALGTTLSSILTKLGTARTETLWTDDTGAYFVRVDNAGTISWTDTSGTTTSAPGTGSRPAAGTTVLLDKSSYQATATATGYSTGDFLDHLVTTDPSTGAVIGHFWLNTTTEAKLASAPSSANITPLSPLPTGAATAANQTALNALLPASLGTKTAAASLPVTLASDGQYVTSAGAPSDPAWTSGNGSHTALLKAIAANAVSTADSPVEAHQPCDVISFTPTLDTAAYTSGDVLFATTAITGTTRANDLRSLLQSLTVIDKAKQNAAITLLFYQTNVTSAAANAANNLSDADQLSLMGTFDIASADWKTWANNSTVCYSGAKSPGLLLEAATGSTTVYVVGITTSTPTYAVGDLVFKFGFVQQ